MSGEKMSDRISIVRWRDPKTDPPAHLGLTEIVLVDVERNGKRRVGAVSVELVMDEGFQAFGWAELPVPSDATWEDLRTAADALDWIAQMGGGLGPRADRLRVLLGAETDRQEEG